MPVAPSRNHAGRALLAAVVGVGLVMVFLWGAAVLYSHQSPSKVSLGDQTFQAGSARKMAKAISNGGPAAFSDASPSHDRDILLQHIGTDLDHGWYAFSAQPANKDRTCLWKWQRAEHLFRASCDHNLTLPADGRGTTQYPVTVSNGSLSIDLNAADRAATSTTTKPSTTILLTGQH